MAQSIDNCLPHGIPAMEITHAIERQGFRMTRLDAQKLLAYLSMG